MVEKYLHVLDFWFNSKLIENNSHWSLLSQAQGFSNVGNLIFSVAEPQRGVDEGEEDREDHSGEENQDAAKLVDHEVAEAECGDHHDGGMVLLQRLHLHLRVCKVVQGSKYYSHGDHPQHHFARVEKADEGEDEEC